MPKREGEEGSTLARQRLRSEASQPSLRPCRTSAGMKALKAMLGTIAAFAPPLLDKRRVASIGRRARDFRRLRFALAGCFLWPVENDARAQWR